MFIFILIQFILIITFSYVGQLERKMNIKIDRLHSDYVEGLTQLNRKYQELKEQSSTVIEVLKKELKREDQKIEQIDQDIPKGFVYTELPGQLPPTKMWPHLKWKDITPDYAGLFFRAEGGNAAPYGKIQQANQSWISNIYSLSYYYDSWQGPHATTRYHFPLDQGNWSKNVNPVHALLSVLHFFTTPAENRPRNIAIKLWQRVG